MPASLLPLDSAEMPVAYSLKRGTQVLKHLPEQHRQHYGQFLTPATIARFMARQLAPIRDGARVLDPAAGSATLLCAIIEEAVRSGTCRELFIDSFELDPALKGVSQEVLEVAVSFAADHGVTVHVEVIQADFILEYCTTMQPGLFARNGTDARLLLNSYDYVIANPPYFKLNSQDPRVRAAATLMHGTTNIYALFMAVAARLLAEKGHACFLVPRSFCSGTYFGKFRRELLHYVTPVSIHVFGSRTHAFKQDSVLQENIVFTFRQRRATEQLPHWENYPDVIVSHSEQAVNPTQVRQRSVKFNTFVFSQTQEIFFRLPTSDLDEDIINIVDTWTGSLATHGLRVSTGPIVPFRARSLLTDAQTVVTGGAAPLLWMQNVQQQRVVWPIDRRGKPQGVFFGRDAKSLLVPRGNYVLLRRFSAKEDTRRLVAAPLLAQDLAYDWLGLENHLNYIYGDNRVLGEDEVRGLSALLNSAFLDRYFRMTNGTTQVNATELRALPLPPLDLINAIGRTLRVRTGSDPGDLDGIVFDMLRRSNQAFMDLPAIQETRIKMGKIQEAQEILRTLGLPKAQQNEIAALTLLVLAQVSEDDHWSTAKRQSLGIHKMMREMSRRYDRTYAENTRETVRRQVIHQFVQAGLVVRNPDESTLPTNSPRTHYALSDETIRVLRTYGSDTWLDSVATFMMSKGALLDLYQKQQNQHKIPLVLESGEKYHLSPGKHNALQVAIVEEFGPRFAPGARLLYLGDTTQKVLILDNEGFAAIGLPVPSHDKLPDVVLLDTQRNWLFLVEAVTSHGPVSPKRRIELEEAMRGCSAGRIYVSAFPDFATFKAYLTQIAWETEVWLAELPAHLIHFNGDRFMGPRD